MMLRAPLFSSDDVAIDQLSKRSRSEVGPVPDEPVETPPDDAGLMPLDAVGVPRRVFGFPVPSASVAATMSDASLALPFTVVACFDHSLRADVVYASPARRHRVLTFSFNGTLYPSIPELSAAMIVAWRNSDPTGERQLPLRVSWITLRHSDWLLCRCGRRVVSLTAAKRARCIATGGCAVSTAGLSIGPDGASSPTEARAASHTEPLMPPFEVHYQGMPQLCATVVALRIVREEHVKPRRWGLELHARFEDRLFTTLPSLFRAMKSAVRRELAVALQALRTSRSSAAVPELPSESTETSPGADQAAEDHQAGFGYEPWYRLLVEQRNGASLAEMLFRGAFDFYELGSPCQGQGCV